MKKHVNNFLTRAPELEASLEYLSSSRKREGMSFSGNTVKFHYIYRWIKVNHQRTSDSNSQTRNKDNISQ